MPSTATTCPGPHRAGKPATPPAGLVAGPPRGDPRTGHRDRRRATGDRPSPAVAVAVAVEAIEPGWEASWEKLLAFVADGLLVRPAERPAREYEVPARPVPAG